MNSINHTLSDQITLLLKCLEQIAQENCINPDLERISNYLKDISSSDIDNDEKRIRKAKYLLNKQIYDISIERGHKPKRIYNPEFMDKMNSVWNFSRAGQSFVMPLSKPPFKANNDNED